MDIISPVTGAAVSGLTSPTYTLVSMAAPNAAATQKYVSALGGTQTNVRVHTVGDPFTITFQNPQTIKLVPRSTTVTTPSGFQPAWPMNRHKFILRKGVTPVNNVSAVSVARLEIDVPAGCSANDLDNIKAALSCLVGAAVQNLNAVVTSIQTGA